MAAWSWHPLGNDWCPAGRPGNHTNREYPVKPFAHGQIESLDKDSSTWRWATGCSLAPTECALPGNHLFARQPQREHLEHQQLQAKDGLLADCCRWPWQLQSGRFSYQIDRFWWWRPPQDVSRWIIHPARSIKDWGQDRHNRTPWGNLRQACSRLSGGPFAPAPEPSRGSEVISRQRWQTGYSCNTHSGKNNPGSWVG